MKEIISGHEISQPSFVINTLNTGMNKMNRRKEKYFQTMLEQLMPKIGFMN